MKKIVLISIIAIVVLGGAGGGAWWYLRGRQPADAAAQAAAEASQKAKAEADRGVIALDPFLVNLADKDASRFLRCTLQLAVDNKEFAAGFGGKGGHGAEDPHALAKARLRSTVLEVLTTQTAERLVTTEGKAELKKAIAEHASHVLEEAKVVDVLFTDFVVQF